MNQGQLAGFLLIAGFVSILIASMVGPPRLYQEPESETRLQIIANHPTRWAAANLFFALGGLVTAGGLTFFSLGLRGSVNMWLVGLSAVAYILGAIIWAAFMYQRTVNPASLFTSYAFSPLTVALLGLIVIGLLLYGVVFLQAGYPGWLGIGMIAGMALIGGAALLFPTRFFEAFPPQVLYLFTLIAGIVMLRK
ncbi:MAG TPA: hypothetical protein VFZ76_19565 [Anaerolineales bacterium]